MPAFRQSAVARQEHSGCGETIQRMVLLKTENHKSPNDFLVRTVFSVHPSRSTTPKHAHFAIDFYGNLCADRSKALAVLEAIRRVWSGQDPKEVLEAFEEKSSGLPGYPLEYILYALRWIMDQEDVNVRARPQKAQQRLDQMFTAYGWIVPKGREASSPWPFSST